MSDPDGLAEAARWIRFAREDLDLARKLLREAAGPPRHVCWLAQQAAEKGLKAALICLQIDFPRSHDLDALRNLLPADWNIRLGCSDLAELTEWAVEARYPSDWPEATLQDAEKAVGQAGSVVDLLSDELRHRGVC